MDKLKELLVHIDYQIFNNSLYIWFLALCIFLFFVLARKKFAKSIVNLLEKLTSKTKTEIDDYFLEILEPPLRLVFVLVGLIIFKSFLTLPEQFDLFLTKLFRSLAAFTIFWSSYRAITVFSPSLKTAMKKYGSELSNDLSGFIIKALKVVVFILGFMTIVQEWGYNLSAFVASLGIGGLAFALAAKDTAANLFGSLVIFTDRPFKVGDWIKTPSVEGTIEEIGVRSTQVRTFAQALVNVPNATLANSPITNWSRMGKRRIKMNLGLTYNTTATQMQTILEEVRVLLKNHPDIHQETIFIHFTDFNDSSLDIFCYFFTKTINWGEYMQVRENINLSIMKIVEEQNASFAFPSQSLYIEKEQKHPF